LNCLKHAVSWSEVGETVRVQVRENRFGSLREESYTPVASEGAMGGAAASILEAAAADMRRKTGLRNPPPVRFVRSTGGAGGLYFPSANQVLVGLEDARAIALDIWNRHRDYVRERVEGLLIGSRGSAVDLFTFLWIAVAARIVAHELGHAIIAARGNTTGIQNEEAAADFIAGELDAIRGKSRELGRLVFEAIGCVGRWCEHPPPEGRAEAYERGYTTWVS